MQNNICNLCNIHYENQDDHLLVCESIIVQCKLCESYLENKVLKNHIDNDCQNRIVNCTYNNIGCFAQILYKDLENHLDKEIKFHHILTLKEISLLKEKHKLFNESIERFDKKLCSIEEEVSIIKTNLDYYNVEIKREVEESKTDYDNKIKSHYNNLIQSVNACQETVDKNKETINALYSIINK